MIQSVVVEDPPVVDVLGNPDAVVQQMAALNKRAMEELDALQRRQVILKRVLAITSAAIAADESEQRPMDAPPF